MWFRILQIYRLPENWALSADTLIISTIGGLIDYARTPTGFAFRGDGHGMTGVSGVLLGDSAIDTGGDQADASLSYVDLIQNYTGKTLSRPRGYMAARYR